MKATILAKFFDELSRQQIPFSVDEIHGQSYEVAFGIKEQECGDKIADGIYLQVWATKNSLCNDIVTDFLDKNMPMEFRVEIPLMYVMRQRMMWITTNDVDHDEWLYIIKIED